MLVTTTSVLRLVDGSSPARTGAHVTTDADSVARL
jgi:hypothetical protein